MSYSIFLLLPSSSLSLVVDGPIITGLVLVFSSGTVLASAVGNAPAEELTSGCNGITSVCVVFPAVVNTWVVGIVVDFDTTGLLELLVVFVGIS